MSDIPEHLQSLFKVLLDLPVTIPSSPWRHVGCHAIGGLTDVGFVQSSDILLVVSSAGRGLFDCLTGERIARDASEDFEHDTSNLLVIGIGPVASQEIRTAGIHGGGLAVTTSDGWSLDLLTLSWPSNSLFLTPPNHWLYDPAFKKIPGASMKITVEDEMRAFGFSPTGSCLIFATSSDITIFCRKLA
jgi:hypothetical protein